MVVHEGGEDVEGLSYPGKKEGPRGFVVELQVEEDVRTKAVDPLAVGAREWGRVGVGAGAGAGVGAGLGISSF